MKLLRPFCKALYKALGEGFTDLDKRAALMVETVNKLPLRREGRRDTWIISSNSSRSVILQAVMRERKKDIYYFRDPAITPGTQQQVRAVVKDPGSEQYPSEGTGGAACHAHKHSKSMQPSEKEDNNTHLGRGSWL